MERKINQADRHKATYAFEVKSIAPDGTFAGYASVFDVIDSQQDVVKPGAFRRSLKTRDEPVRLLWQHQWESPIGVIETLFEDVRGLYMKGRLLLDVAQAREAYSLLKAGIVKGLSIGYSVKRASRNPNNGVRLLHEIDLWEVSLVTFPANEAAQVTVVKSHRPPLEPEVMSVTQLMAAIDRAGVALLSGVSLH